MELVPRDPKKSPLGKVDPETGEVFEDLENADDEIREPVVVTDEMRKEDFLISLGLITKKALSELQNKKTVRKRRTTANPHFSNAAIEAKRINQMEMAARKAKRKEQARTRYSLVYRNSRTTTTTTTSTTAADGSATDAHRKSSPLSPVEQNISSQSSQVSPYYKLVSHMCKDCAVCKELCQPVVDVIILCLNCPCLFHATCATTLQEFASSGYFNCPTCDRKKTLADEITDFDAPLSDSITDAGLTHHHHHHNSGKHKRRKLVDSGKNGSGQDMITLNQGNNVVSRVSFRSHYDEKRAELLMLMEKKEILELEWMKRKDIYNETISSFSLTQQQVTALEQEGKKIENDVNRLVGFIRSVKIWTEIIDPDEDQPVPHKAVPLKDFSSSAAAPVLTASTTMMTTMASPMTTIICSSPSISGSIINTEPMDGEENNIHEEAVLVNAATVMTPIDNNSHTEAVAISPKQVVQQSSNKDSCNHNSSSETNGITSNGTGSSSSEPVAAIIELIAEATVQQ